MAKVSFGILALNAQPFLEYNLHALYPFAHEIIVAEGAVRSASAIARPDGHSQDGTLEMLQIFKRAHDSKNKLRILSASEFGYKDGFWPEKDEMSQAYAACATGDWLWQVDSDEFYLESDMAAMLQHLDQHPEVSGYSFPYIEFFGSFDSYITGEWHQFAHPRFHRLFRWGPGYVYHSHRPPTVLNSDGRNLRELNYDSNPRNNGKTISLYHYSYVFPHQARQKVEYYANVMWTDAFRKNKTWYEKQYLHLNNPMRLGELGGLQWLERFKGSHPLIIQQLQQDIKKGLVNEQLRPVDDIDKLLSSPLYRVQRVLARTFLWLYWPLRVAWKRIRNHLLSIRAGEA